MLKRVEGEEEDLHEKTKKKSAALSGLEQNSRDKSFFVCKTSKIIFISNNILLQLNICF